MHTTNRLTFIVVTVIFIISLVQMVAGSHSGHVWSSLVIPSIMVAVIAEQLAAKATPGSSGAALLNVLKVSGFVFALTLLIVSGVKGL